MSPDGRSRFSEIWDLDVPTQVFPGTRARVPEVERPVDINHSYVIAASFEDDYAGSTATTGTIAIDGSISGNIESPNDSDWFRAELLGDAVYLVSVRGGPLFPDPLIQIRNRSGAIVASAPTIMYISPTADGGFYIDVSSQTGTGTGPYTLSLGYRGGTQPDDYTDTPATTGRVAVGGTTSGRIQTTDDRDWFRVNLTAGVTYFVDMIGDLGRDTYVSLRDANGAILASDDDSGEYEDAQLSYTPVTTGTYFIEARGAISSIDGYTISVTQASTPDDYAATTATTGTLAFRGSVAGVINVPTDRDWFRVNLVAGQPYAFEMQGFGAGSLTIPQFLLLDSSGGSVRSANNSGVGASLDYTPRVTGTYYVEAIASDPYYHRPGTGKYTLSLAPLDDYRGTVATTGNLSTRTPTTANINEAGDVDWFRITLISGTRYQIDVRGSASAGGTLADPAVSILDTGGMVLRADNDSGLGSDGRILYTPSVTTSYYVAVRSGVPDGTGTYTVAVTENPDDYAATSTTAGAVAVDGFAVGNLEAVNDRDWFKVALTAGITYRVSVRGADARYGTLRNPQLAIIDAAGASVANDDDSGYGSDAAVSFTPPSSGTYYIQASGAPATTGTYTVFVATQAADDYAGTTATTGTVTVGGSVSGNTEVIGDRDWFRVTLIAGLSYRIRLEPAQYGNLPSTFASVSLRDSSGTALSSDEESGAAAVAELNYTATATGPFYIDAEAYNLASANYRISVARVVSPVTAKADGVGLTDAELAAVTAPPAISLEDLQIAAPSLAPQRDRSPLDILFDGLLALPVENRDLAMTADPFQRLAAFQPGNVFTLFPSG